MPSRTLATLVALATLVPALAGLPLSLGADPVGCAVFPDDAGSGGDAGDLEALATPLALSGGVFASTGCLHPADPDDWYRVMSVPGPGHNLLVEMKGTPGDVAQTLFLTNCQGKSLVQAYLSQDGYVRVRMSFTPEYEALCVTVAPVAAGIRSGTPPVYTGMGREAPYEIRFTLTKAPCVDDDAGSGRDTDWVRPHTLAIDPYGEGGSFTGCFPGEGWYDFQAHERWDDHYLFQAEAGRPFHIEARALDCTSWYLVSVYGPASATNSQSWVAQHLTSLSVGCGGAGLTITPKATGLQRIRVYDEPGQYEIRLGPARHACGVQDDAGSGRDAPSSMADAPVISDGAGCLDESDSMDVYRIPVAANERVSVNIAYTPHESGPSKSLYVTLSDERGNAVKSWYSSSYWDPSTSGVLTGISGWSGMWSLTLSSGPIPLNYTVSVTREPLEHPLILPTGSYTKYDEGPIASCGDEVYHLGKTGNLYRLNGTAALFLQRNFLSWSTFPHSLACSEEGTRLFWNEERTVEGQVKRHLMESRAPHMGGQPVGSVEINRAFPGPGGSIYDVSGTTLRRLDCTTRTFSAVQPVPSQTLRYSFGPDGTLYALDGSRLHRVGPAGELVQVASLAPITHATSIAFDTAGHAYVTGRSDTVIVRVDLATGETRPHLAGATGGGHLAFQGSRLWASIGSGTNRINYYDLDVPGFEGWKVSCDLPYADLKPTITDVTRTDGQVSLVPTAPDSYIEVHVDVTNLGPVEHRGGYTVTVETVGLCDADLACPLPYTRHRGSIAIEEALAPGATRSVTLSFPAEWYVDPERIIVRLTAPELGDGDPTNNGDERQHRFVEGPAV